MTPAMHRRVVSIKSYGCSKREGQIAPTSIMTYCNMRAAGTREYGCAAVCCINLVTNIEHNCNMDYMDELYNLKNLLNFR